MRALRFANQGRGKRKESRVMAVYSALRRVGLRPARRSGSVVFFQFRVEFILRNLHQFSQSGFELLEGMWSTPKIFHTDNDVTNDHRVAAAPVVDL